MPGTCQVHKHRKLAFSIGNSYIIPFQSKASFVCSVTTALFIDFCLKKLNVFSQHIGTKTNEYLDSTEKNHKELKV